MKQHGFRFLAIALGAALLVTAPAPADIGINVSPAKFQLAMTPGSTYNVPITVSNGTGDATHIQATMVDFGVAENGDYQIQHVGARPNSLMRWASMNPREFDLPANSTQQVRLSLAVPPSGVTGEYAGIVFFQTRPTRRAGATVSFAVRVATKIYLSIPGTVKIDGAISKMNESHAPGRETYRVLFKNTGNAHVYLRGELSVKKDGVTVDRMVMPAEMLVERGGSRLIEMSGKALPSGKYEAIATIDYGGTSITAGEIAFERP